MTINGHDHNGTGTHPAAVPDGPVNLDMAGTDVHHMDACTVFVGREPGTRRWHLAIIHPHRRATLGEVAAARAAYIPPGVRMVLVVPDGDDRVPLHLWEVPGAGDGN